MGCLKEDDSIKKCAPFGFFSSLLPPDKSHLDLELVTLKLEATDQYEGAG